MIKQLILASMATFTLVACSGTKKTTEKNNDSDNEMVSTDVKMQEEPKSTNEPKNNSNSSGQIVVGTAAQANGSTGAMNNTLANISPNNSTDDYNSMFTALNMTDEQINTFNTAMNRFKKKQKNTASGEMLGSIESERTRQLENILSSEQFAKYEKLEMGNN